MDAFTLKWDSEVKQLAKNCVDNEFIMLLSKADSDTLTQSEEERLKEIAPNFEDPYGMWYISNMIFRVEHDLADSRDAGAKLAVLQIYFALASEDYIPNVWKNDTSSTECQNLLKLRDSLAELVKL